MLKIPNEPFKTVEFGNDDPLVVAAYKKRGVNEPCWCGSGIKFKRCHLGREHKQRPSFRQILAITNKIFWQRKKCLHGDILTPCEGTVIDAHSIQRKGVLEKIATAHHVYCLEPDRSTIESVRQDYVVKKRSWRKASTFPGFCAKHDSELFSPIELAPFSGSHEQCVLQAYRSVCNELYKKRGAIATIEYQRHEIDKGQNLDNQISFQKSCQLTFEATKKTLEEVESLKGRLQKAIQTSNYQCFKTACFFFDGDFGIVSSGMCHIEFSFTGDKLSDIWDLSLNAPCITHSLMTTSSGGAFFFCWDTEAEEGKQFLKSFKAIGDIDKPDVFVQYCFLQSENTYFSEVWWNDLPEKTKRSLTKLAGTHYYEGGAYKPSGLPLVDWKITGFRES